MCLCVVDLSVDEESGSDSGFGSRSERMIQAASARRVKTGRVPILRLVRNAFSGMTRRRKGGHVDGRDLSWVDRQPAGVRCR